jgi:sulfite reductase (NADPH) hemoprotein beta-component
VWPEVGAPVAAGTFREWRRTNVRAQKQSGCVIAVVTLPLGDVTGAQLRLLADLAAAYGDGTVRTTPDQDLFLRWVREDALPELHRRLTAAGLGRPGAGTLADVTSCPGAEACRLAVTQSRGLGRVLNDHLQAHPELAAAAPGLDVKISGCPNGCAQHHVAGIGLQGSVRRVGDRVVPQYFLLLGGALRADGARFGRLAAKLPARRVPLAVERLVALYASDARPGESAPDFLARLEPAAVKSLLADLDPVTSEDFVDLGEEQPFTVQSAAGECAV